MNAGPSNAGGWEKSEARAWLANEVLPSFPDDLEKAITPVEKTTNNLGNADAENPSASLSVTDDALWIPSAAEIWGQDIAWFTDDQAWCNDVLAEEGGNRCQMLYTGRLRRIKRITSAGKAVSGIRMLQIGRGRIVIQQR